MSSRRRPIPSVLIAAVAAALLLAGCSSSTGGSATSGGSTPPATTSATTPAQTPSSTVADPAESTTSAASTSGGASVPGSADASAGTSPADSSPSADSSSSAGGKQEPADPATCASVAQVYGAIINATLPILQGKTGPEPFDAQALSDALKIKTMGTLPPELAPDFAAYQSAAEQLRGKDLSAAAALLNGPELTKASGDIDKYTSDRC